MKPAQQILACLLLVILTIEEGLSTEVSVSPLTTQTEGLFCHSCNTFKNPDCDKIVDDRYKVPCSANQTICRKVEQHMYYNKEDHVRVFRQCATRGTPGGCDSRTGTYRFKTWYCHCKGDLCNSSGGVMASVMLTFTLICASLGLGKWL